MVSAGALHAQGWGFESLIAHQEMKCGSGDGAAFWFGRAAGDSNPEGAERCKRASVCRGAAHAAEAGGAAPAALSPSSPTRK